MKKRVFIYLLISFLSLLSYASEAQCSICAKTAQQMGEGPAKGMNTGILYLMFTPLALAGYIGFRWWRTNGRD